MPKRSPSCLQVHFYLGTTRRERLSRTTKRVKRYWVRPFQSTKKREEKASLEFYTRLFTSTDKSTLTQKKKTKKKKTRYTISTNCTQQWRCWRWQEWREDRWRNCLCNRVYAVCADRSSRCASHTSESHLEHKEKTSYENSRTVRGKEERQTDTGSVERKKDADTRQRRTKRREKRLFERRTQNWNMIMKKIVSSTKSRMVNVAGSRRRIWS